MKVWQGGAGVATPPSQHESLPQPQRTTHSLAQVHTATAVAPGPHPGSPDTRTECLSCKDPPPSPLPSKFTDRPLQCSHELGGEAFLDTPTPSGVLSLPPDGAGEGGRELQWGEFRAG